MSSSPQRPIVTELRLSAFKSHRGATFPLEPLTLLAGASGTGKSSVLEGLAVLGRLASGADLQEVFAVSGTGRSFVRGGAAACVPQGARADAQGRRGFRIGCTTSGPLGPVRLDLAVQVEPTLRIVGERLTGSGETLLTTALRDPTRPSVQAAWHTAGAVAVTRAPLPDDRLATSLLPLRVSGRTEGQRLVLSAAEQLVVALRGVFPIAPRPELMRGPVRVGDGRLRGSCDNLSAVLARTEHECSIRHGMLVGAVRDVCSGPVRGLTALPALMAGDGREPLVEAVIAAVDRGALGMVPVDRLGDGELRFLAMALVLLTGPGVLDVDTSTEHLPAGQVLTVVADGLDVGVDRRQARELLRLAGIAAARGHIRLLCTVQDPAYAEGIDTAGGVALTVLGAGSKVTKLMKKKERAGEGEEQRGGESAGAGGGARPEGVGDSAGASGSEAGGDVADAAEAGGMADVAEAADVADLTGAAGAGDVVSSAGATGSVDAELSGDGVSAAGATGSVDEDGVAGAVDDVGGAGAGRGAGDAEDPDPGDESAVGGAERPCASGPGGVERQDAGGFAGEGDGASDGASARAEPTTGNAVARDPWAEAVDDERGPVQPAPSGAVSPDAPFARPASGASPYGEAPFDQAGYDDFGYGGLAYDDSEFDDSEYEAPDHRGFDRADYVYTESVDDVPGHAEPAWFDAAFAQPAPPDPAPAGPPVQAGPPLPTGPPVQTGPPSSAGPSSTAAVPAPRTGPTRSPAPRTGPTPVPAPTPQAGSVPPARGEPGVAGSPHPPCTCAHGEPLPAAAEGEDEVDQSE